MSNYFNIDDILATQERIPCRFLTVVHNMGYLDPGSESEHLQIGTQLELPLWLARALCSRRRHTAAIEIPKQYKEGYREILSADPEVVDLHKLGPYYYSCGRELLCFEHPDSEKIAKSLLTAFQGRLRRVMDISQNTMDDVGTTVFKEHLDETELEIYAAGQRALKDFLSWESRRIIKLMPSDVVTNMKKRKRVHDTAE